MGKNAILRTILEHDYEDRRQRRRGGLALLRFHGLPALGNPLSTQPPGSVGVSIVTVEESLRGRLAQHSRASDGRTRIRRYAMLAETIQLFDHLPVALYDDAAESHFQQHRYLRIGTQDLKFRGHHT